MCVSDLHLGKSDRIARKGGALLPPYETRETLTRLNQVIVELCPEQVICLGDSFDDLAAFDALDDTDHDHLASMMAGRRWIWIEGNHDPGPVTIGGSHLAEVKIDGITFRHIANPDASGEVSGHFHPKARIRSASRPCFLVDSDRIILPAFGAYTGGLRSDSKALCDLMNFDAIAILTGQRAMPAPMPRK